MSHFFPVLFSHVVQKVEVTHRPFDDWGTDGTQMDGYVKKVKDI